MKKLILICLAIMTLVACKKEGFTTYEGDTDLYFNYHTYVGSTNYVLDSLILPFNKAVIFKDVSDSTLRIPVRCTGRMADYDRRFKIVVEEGWQLVNTEDKTVLAKAAKEGVDYEIFYDNLVIEAGKITGSVFVKVLKPAESEDTFVIKIRLIPYEDFVLNYKTTPLYGSSNIRIPLTEFRIYFNNKLAKPANWGASADGYYGAYSNRKLELLMELAPLVDIAYWYITEYRAAFPDDPDVQSMLPNNPPSPYSVVYMSTIGKWLKDELAKRKAANGGVGEKDENGIEMIAGKYV